jgi:small-conductance mechanosensitive channel
MQDSMNPDEQTSAQETAADPRAEDLSLSPLTPPDGPVSESAGPGPEPTESAAAESVEEAPTQPEAPVSQSAAPSQMQETTEAPSAPDPGVPYSWIDFFKPEGIPYAIIVLVLMTVVAKVVSRESERLGERFADRRLMIQQAGSFIRFLVYVGGLVFAVLTLFELTEQMILAIGGTLAVAAGFAMKDLVASLIAGVIVLMDRPFQVGDRVSFTGYYGEITNIGLRSVRMMTLDDTQITIPNNKFLTDAVASANAGAVDMMIQVDLFIGVDQDLGEARRLLSEVVTTSRYVNLNRKWSVLAAETIEQSYFAIRLRAKAYVLDARLEKAFQGDITERALEAFEDAGIGPPAVLHRNVDFRAMPEAQQGKIQ